MLTTSFPKVAYFHSLAKSTSFVQPPPTQHAHCPPPAPHKGNQEKKTNGRFARNTRPITLDCGTYFCPPEIPEKARWQGPGVGVPRTDSARLSARHWHLRGSAMVSQKQWGTNVSLNRLDHDHDRLVSWVETSGAGYPPALPGEAYSCARHRVRLL